MRHLAYVDRESARLTNGIPRAIPLCLPVNSDKLLRVKSSVRQNCASSWTAVSAQSSRTTIEALRLTSQRLLALTVKCSGSPQPRVHTSQQPWRTQCQGEPSWANSKRLSVSSHALIGGVSQARAANVVLRLIRAGSCGEAGARTPIMC